jgi:hypothetical protein
MSAAQMTPEQWAKIQAQQERDWPIHIAGGRHGNPFATLCQHCYGRHRPPLDEICPYDPPPPSRSTST